MRHLSNPISPSHSPSGNTFSTPLLATQDKILALLDDFEASSGVVELSHHITGLTQAIQIMNDTTSYTYGDYPERLMISQEELKSVFEEKILSNPSMRVHYDAILAQVQDKDFRIDRLWEVYFYELSLVVHGFVRSKKIRLSLDNVKPKKNLLFQNKPLVLAPDISRVQFGFIKPRHTAQQIAWVFAGMSRVEHIDLTCAYLGRLSQAQRDAIFSSLGHLKSINLNQVGLSKLDTKSLNAIFCHLGSLESIDLTQNDFFRETYKERIDAVFSHLPQLKTIHIGSNSLKFLDDECLLRLGSYFQNVISLFWVSDLRENVTPKRLEMIFSNLPRLKSIDLSYNDIGSWDEPSLRVLFSSLSQVKWINFISNELSHIPFDLLVSLFSELKEAKLIKVTEGERFFSHLIERLPHLKDSLLYSR